MVGSPSCDRANSRWLTPSSLLWRVRCLQVGVGGLFIATVLGIVGGLISPTIGIITAGGALGCVLAALWFVRNRFRSWAYQEREEDLMVSRGVLVHRLSVVPYGRMQYVDVTAGPIERAFKLATVRLHTAAAASDARIPGLDRDEAARLRDRLTELGEAKAAGL